MVQTLVMNGLKSFQKAPTMVSQVSGGFGVSDSLVFGDADDPSKREEERMNRHADASLGRAVDNRAQGGPKKVS